MIRAIMGSRICNLVKINSNKTNKHTGCRIKVGFNHAADASIAVESVAFATRCRCCASQKLAMMEIIITMIPVSGEMVVRWNNTFY